MTKAGTILHAEDDENDAHLFQIVLSRVGVHNPYAWFPNGEGAVHYMKGVGSYGDREKYPFPCLLITDLKMPVLSGFDLLSQIKDKLEANELRAIVLTASVADCDRERCRQLGADAYFVKPTDLSGWMRLAGELKQAWIPAAMQPA